MSSGVPNNSARRSVSYAASEVADADGIKTSFSTSTSVVNLDSADWNGAALGAGETVLDLPRTVSITLSANADQFTTDPIVVTGTRGGVVVTESLTALDNDGNVTLRGTQPFDSVTAIDIPAMDGTGGTITIGVQDICAPHGQIFQAVELHAAGDINVAYGGTDIVPAHTDTIPVGTAQVGFPKPIAPKRVLTSPELTSPTDVGVTVYLP